MGVLFVMPTYATPSELWMQRMLAALRDRLAGIACYHPGAPTWNDACPTIDLIDRARSVGTLRGAIDRLKPTSILIHYLPFAMQLQDAWQGRAPTFVHAHGYDITWTGRRHEPPHERRFDEGYPSRVVALSRIATILANSHATRRTLEAVGVEPSRIVVKHLGVPVPSSIPDRDAGPVRVLYLGRLVDFKGPSLTVDAFARAVRMGLDATLTLAGDGPMRDECLRAVAQSGVADRITMTGEVDAPTGQRLRREAHLFTAHNQTGPISNQQEAFGVSYVEAMAEGLPVVTGRNGSIPELIDDGVEGLLFEPGDVDAHARALLRLGTDASLRSQLGEAAHGKARACFSIERETAQLRQLML
jgi:glycosyltransferase involved in cell wall biosynthesis